MKVLINHRAESGEGQLVINYKTLEDLDELCRVLTATPLAGSR
ncbi:hypothetical protein [Acidimangrovimonas pyrenivorans]